MFHLKVEQIKQGHAQSELALQRAEVRRDGVVNATKMACWSFHLFAI